MVTRRRRAGGGVSKERAIIMKIQELWRRTTLGQRAMITVGIVVAVLIAMALYGYFTGAWEKDETEHTQTELRPSLAAGLPHKWLIPGVESRLAY